MRANRVAPAGIGSKEIAAAAESYGGAIEVSMRQCSIVRHFGGRGFGAAPQEPNTLGLTALAIWVAILFALTLGGSLPFILADQNFDEAMGSGALPPLRLG